MKEVKIIYANFDDIELLRNWKNENRDYFFYKEIITPEQQKKWFNEYWNRKNDFMFIVKYRELKIGCLGYRLEDGIIDIYNVIMGNKKFCGRKIMSYALKLICQDIKRYYKNDITLKVLNSNGAKKFYEKNGFKIVEIKDNYTFMRLTK